MTNICVIDYGMSNIHSVAKALEKVSDRKFKITIANSINNIKNSSHIVFPGQGAASSCMKNIKNNFEMSELKELITNRFFLGICMGMQVLMTQSKEGGTEQCLDIFSGEVEYLGDYQDSKLTLPHMGWNNVTIKHSHDILKGISDNSFFYFVHSYFTKLNNISEVLTTTNYGYDFASAISRENIVALQFHPEKSSSNGLRILKNFINWEIK